MLSLTIERRFCDSCCSVDKMYKCVQSLVPGLWEHGTWVGGFTQEKAKTWEAAFEEAKLKFGIECFVFQLDCEYLVICRKCLEAILAGNLSPGDQQKDEGKIQWNEHVA